MSAYRLFHPPAPPTAREREIYVMHKSGMTRREVAKALNLKPKTIENVLNHYRTKIKDVKAWEEMKTWIN